MTFKKGQSGNPEGLNTSSAHRNKILRDKLMPEADKLFKQLMKHVKSEDEAISLNATKDALDRLYGKAMASVEMSGPDGSPLALMLERALSADEFATKFAPKAEE